MGSAAEQRFPDETEKTEPLVAAGFRCPETEPNPPHVVVVFGVVIVVVVDSLFDVLT